MKNNREELMGRIIKPLPVTGGLLDNDGNLVEKDLKDLFRTSIEHSIIRKDVAGEICKIIPTRLKNLWYFNREIKVGDKCSLETIIDNKIVGDNAYILDDVFGDEFDLVLGMDTLQRFEMELSLTKETVNVKRIQNIL